MKKIGYLIMSSLLLAGIGAQAQDQQRAPFCGTDSPEMLEFVNNDPQALKNREALEKFTAEYIKNMAHSKKSNHKIIIPIVFHLIYDNRGVGLIPDKQVYNALETINKDYNKLNADTASTIPYFQPRAANVGFEFRIAKIDPNGNCTNGITRHEIDATNAAGENVKHLLDAAQWDPKKYMNVWVVNNIASGAGGYAYYPGSGGNGGYGILIRASQFGYGGVSNGDDGSVGSLTHELGHCFNLAHVWGNSNTPGQSTNCGSSFTDNVGDTPKTEGNQSCNKSKKPCTGDTNLYANVQNYMDYSFCYTMFTNGQKARMIAALNSSTGGINNLWTDANLIATGTDDAYAGNPCAPKASNIMANNKIICSGKTIKFYDVTTNSPHPLTRQWSFPGGTPSTSTDSSVTVTYNTPGIHDVKLVVSNQYGTDSITKTQMIHVLDAAPTLAMPYKNDFEAGTFTDTTNKFFLLNNGGVTAWEQVTGTYAHSGSNTLRLLNTSASNGVTNSFTLPPINFTGKTKGYLVFYMAHATRNNTTQSGTAATDKFTVLGQGGCTNTWSLKYTKNDTALRTTKTLYASGTYVPKIADWEKVTINLSSYAGLASVLLKFDYYSSGGNAMYIDDINIVEDPATVTAINDADMARELNINVYPNPVENSTATLSFNLIKEEKVKVSIFDVLGREVSVLKQESIMNAGQHQLQINVMPAGVYYVKVAVGSHSFTQKLMMN